MTYRLFHNGAEIEESIASAMLIDASLYQGYDIRDLRHTYALALDFSDNESLDSMMAREDIFSQVEIEIIPAGSDSLVCTANPCGIHDIPESLSGHIDEKTGRAYGRESDYAPNVAAPCEHTITVVSETGAHCEFCEKDMESSVGDIWRQGAAPATPPISDHERLAAMSFQSVANLVLRESAEDSDRMKAWEYLNASADDIGRVYWGGLSTMARSRILGAMALDLSAFGFVTAES